MIRSSGEYWVQRLFQYFFQGLFVRALAYGFFTVDDGKLQLVLDRQRFHMGGGLGLPFAFFAGKVVHVFLQRVAVGGGIAINQLAARDQLLPEESCITDRFWSS